MAATPEKKVKDKVVKLLKQYGAYYFFPATFGIFKIDEVHNARL